MNKSIIEQFKELKAKELNMLRRDNFFKITGMITTSVFTGFFSSLGATLFTKSIIGGLELTALISGTLIGHFMLSYGFDSKTKKNIKNYNEFIAPEIDELREKIAKLITKKINYTMDGPTSIAELARISIELNIQHSLFMVYRELENKKIKMFLSKKSTLLLGEAPLKSEDILENTSQKIALLEQIVKKQALDKDSWLRGLHLNLEETLGISQSRINSVINLNLSPDNISDSSQTYFDYAKLMSEYELSILEWAGKYGKISKDFLIKVISHSSYRINDYDIAYLQNYKTNRDEKGSSNFLAKMIPLLIKKSSMQLAINPKDEYQMAVLAKLLAIEPGFASDLNEALFHETIRLHHYKYKNNLEELRSVSLNQEIEKIVYLEKDYDYYTGMNPGDIKTLSDDKIAAKHKKEIGFNIFKEKKQLINSLMGKKNIKGKTSELNETNNLMEGDQHMWRGYTFKSLSIEAQEHWQKIVQTIDYLGEGTNEFNSLSIDNQAFIKNFLSKTFIQLKDLDRALGLMPSFSDKAATTEKLELTIELSYEKMQEILTDNIQSKNTEIESLALYTNKVMKASR